MIFDTISVKAHRERWCRWNCDLRVIKAFSVVPKASPWRPNHMTICLLHHSGESLQNGQLELRRWNWYFARETQQGYSRISLSLSGWILKEYRNIVSASKQPHAVFHGVCEIALTEVLATQMGAMRRRKKVSSFELYKFNPLSPHCASIARELVHCYTWGRLRIVTVRGNTVGRHS